MSAPTTREEWLQAMALDIVGITEIAERAGTTPGTVRAWRVRHHRTFPRPLVTLSMGPVFDWKKVEAWIAVPRPTGRPRTRTAV